MSKPDSRPEAADTFARTLRTVGERLKEARVKSQMTQREISKKTGLKQSYVFELESGELNMTLRTLAKMAHVYGMNVRDFLPDREVGSASPSAFATFSAALDNTTVALRECEATQAKRQARYEALLAELKIFAALQVPLDSASATGQGTDN